MSPSLTTNAAYDQVRSFANVSSSSYIGMLGQLGNFLDGVSTSEVLDAAMELASHSRIGDLVPIAQILRKGLIDKLLNGEGVPTFNTAQELATQLANVLGLSASTIAANYAPGSKELTYHLIVDHTFANTTVPLGFSINLNPVGGFTSSGEIAVNADGSLELTLGIDLSDPVATLVATAAAPADGKISADANFTLKVGIGEPVSVTLTQSATSNNNSRSDLVDGPERGPAGRGPFGQRCGRAGQQQSSHVVDDAVAVGIDGAGAAGGRLQRRTDRPAAIRSSPS